MAKSGNILFFSADLVCSNFVFSMRKTQLIILGFIAVSIGVLLAMVGKYSSYADFQEAKSDPGKEYHVIGHYDVGQGITYTPSQNADLFSFTMVDEAGVQCEVVCNGDPPREFEKTEQIVAIGKMSGDIFYASEILTKCPSKYVDDELTAATEPT